MEGFKRLIIVAIVFFALVVTLAALTAPDNPGSTQSTGGSPVATGYSHDDLQADAAMTQQMSAPDATGPMHRDNHTNSQLQRSQNPAFLRALEQHQQGLDQMLARPTP
jgi:hypothetical protein